jgi:hypothetical protein
MSENVWATCILKPREEELPDSFKDAVFKDGKGIMYDYVSFQS